jgi:hypothetical protein
MNLSKTRGKIHRDRIAGARENLPEATQNRAIKGVAVPRPSANASGFFPLRNKERSSTRLSKLARLVYRMLQHGKKYVDLGMEFYEAQQPHKQIHYQKRKAAELGFKIVEAPAA